MSRRRRIRELRDELAVLKDRHERTAADIEKVVSPGVKTRLGIDAGVAIGGFASSLATDGFGLLVGSVGVGLCLRDLWQIPIRLNKLQKELDDLEQRIAIKEHTLRQIESSGD